MAKMTTHSARAFTYRDLEDMPDDGYRREIIGGSLIVTPSPSGRHQLVSGSLLVALRQAATAQTVALSAPYDWRLPGGDSVQPDMMVIRRADFDPDGPLPPSATPLLVVEVLSPSNADHDQLAKRALYQSLRVPAYWIVDHRAPSLLALRLHNEHYQVEGEVTGGDTFVTDWPYALRIAPAELGSQRRAMRAGAHQKLAQLVGLRLPAAILQVQLLRHAWAAIDVVAAPQSQLPEAEDLQQLSNVTERDVRERAGQKAGQKDIWFHDPAGQAPG